MDSVVKTSGRVFTTRGITHAIIVRDEMLTVYPVEYHQVPLAGAEALRMIEALMNAGFVRCGDTLINPARITVIEEHQHNVRIYLEGADRILYQPASIVDLLFPALESLTPEEPAKKPKRAKKEAQ